MVLLLRSIWPPAIDTFLLVRFSTYSDYESVNECMEGVCKIYEEHLKRLNPNVPSITYDIAQLFDFIDQVLLTEPK